MSGIPKLFVSKIYKDKRGKLNEILRNSSRIKYKFIIQTTSKKNVFRGLHYDHKTWKLVSCPYGKIFFVVVNCNKNSKNYLKYKSWILDGEKNLQILVPPMYANGHLCLSDVCLFHYKLSYKGKYVDIDKQKILKWNDPKINIKWPFKKKFILSNRDK